MNSFLHIHPNDNVFVALDTLAAGTRVQGDGYDVDGVRGDTQRTQDRGEGHCRGREHHQVRLSDWSRDNGDSGRFLDSYA